MPVEAAFRKMIVPDEYFSIQEAVNNARAGDTIFVKSGIYFENLTVDTSGLKLVGENMKTTIIDGQGTGNVVYLRASNLVLSDFTIQNSGSNWNDSGIYVNNAVNNSIFNNKVTKNNLGVYLFSSSNCTLRNNNITGNQYNFGVSAKNFQEYVHNIDVSNIVDGKPVIYWLNQTNKQPPVNSGYVAIINSTNIMIEDLVLAKNWQAILCAYTTDSTIKNVTVTSSMDAMWLIESTNCSVSGNNVNENNWGGIALVNSNLCSVQLNNITNNKEYGIFLSYSSDNIIYQNNFHNNKRQAWLHGVNKNAWDAGNLLGGNYWSNYNGTDEKSGPSQDEEGTDNIGDTPYVIDQENIDNYPLMEPSIIPPPKNPLNEIWLYVLTGVTTIMISFPIAAYLLKHRKSLANAVRNRVPKGEREVNAR